LGRDVGRLWQVEGSHDTRLSRGAIASALEGSMMIFMALPDSGGEMISGFVTRRMRSDGGGDAKVRGAREAREAVAIVCWSLRNCRLPRG